MASIDDCDIGQEGTCLLWLIKCPFIDHLVTERPNLLIVIYNILLSFPFLIAHQLCSALVNP